MVEPEFIEYGQLNDYHKKALEMDPESKEGFIDENLVVSACESAKTQFDYYANELEEDEGCAFLAAHYWTRISDNHGYQDANNRTAMLCGIGFLNRNGFRLNMTDEETKELGHAIASKRLDREAVAVILVARLAPIQ